MNKHSSVYQSEKVFLHLDKDYYMAGERIWFKSYLVDGYDHMLISGETNIYVELVNFRENLVMKSVFESIDGVVAGGFSLNDSISDGNYLIRAYTNWMRNMGEDYYFQQQLYIANPAQKHYIRRWDLFANRRFNRKLERLKSQHSVTFYPEGGIMLQGVPVKMAWYASNKLGETVAVEGEIEDSSGTAVANIMDDGSGMGYISFVPDMPGTYQAHIRFNGSRRSKRIPLPDVQVQGAVIKADVTADSIQVVVHVKANQGYDEKHDLLLIGHTRGKYVVTETIPLSTDETRFVWPKSLFPAGVAQLYLIDKDLNALSRRLLFIDDKDILNVTVTGVAERPDMLGVELKITDREGQDVAGDFSVSITGYRKTDKRPAGLQDFFLLASELATSVDRPDNFTFDQADPDYVTTDLLMLTNKWERFQLNGVLAGQIPEFVFDHKHGIHFSGEVINPNNDNPLEGHKISLIVKDGVNQRYDAVTDRQGVFEFSDLHFYDLRTVELLADRMREGYFPRVKFFGGQDRSIPFPVNTYSRPQNITRRGTPWKATKRRETSPYQMPWFRDSSPSTSVYGRPSQAIYVTDNDRDNKTLLDFIVQKGTGITVQGGQILIRGAGSIFMDNEPLFLVDGTRTSRGGFLSLSLRDIHRVDVYKGPDASIFGIHGANGALVAITRKGDMYGPSGYEFRMAGFISPGAFITKEHTLVSDVDKNHRPTLFWSPDINPDKQGNISMIISQKTTYDLYQIVIEGIDQKGRILSERFILSLE